MDWQNIETAPRDGTWLLLYCPKGVDERKYDVRDAPRLTLGKFGPSEYQQSNWLSVECWTEYTDYGGYTGVSTCDYQVVVEPTHWMPVPAPPAA